MTKNINDFKVVCDENILSSDFPPLEFNPSEIYVKPIRVEIKYAVIIPKDKS